MALTTTTIFLTLAAGAVYKAYEGIRDYRKLQVDTGNAGINLFHLMPDAPEIEAVRFDFKLSGICAAAAAATLVVGMAMSGPSRSFEVVSAPELGLKGSVQPATAAVVAPPKAEPKDDTRECTDAMHDLAGSICINQVLVTAGSSAGANALASNMRKAAETCGRYDAQPYISAGMTGSKSVIAGVVQGKVDRNNLMDQCFLSTFNALGGYKIQPKPGR